MSAIRAIACLVTAAAYAALAGCEEAPPLGVNLDDGSAFLEGGEPGGATPSGSKELDLDVCDPSAGGFSTVSTNPWFPMGVGQQWTYEGEEDGVPVSLLITVLDETRLIAGVTTRVIEERDDGRTTSCRRFRGTTTPKQAMGQSAISAKTSTSMRKTRSSTRARGAQRIRRTRRVRPRSPHRLAESDMRETDRGSAIGTPPSGHGNQPCEATARRCRSAG